MNIKNYFILLGILCIAISCSNKSQQQNEEELECSCPHATICLQPYEDFSKEEAEKLVPVLQENFDKWIYGGWEFKVLNPKKLPKGSEVVSVTFDTTSLCFILLKTQRSVWQAPNLSYCLVGTLASDDVHTT